MSHSPVPSRALPLSSPFTQCECWDPLEEFSSWAYWPAGLRIVMAPKDTHKVGDKCEGLLVRRSTKGRVRCPLSNPCLMVEKGTLGYCDPEALYKPPQLIKHLNRLRVHAPVSVLR